MKNIISEVSIKRKIVYKLLVIVSAFLSTCCNQHITNRINKVTIANKADSIYVTYPIIECRRQFAKDYFHKDDEPVHLAETLTANAIKGLFKNGFYFSEADEHVSSKLKLLLDSCIQQFGKARHDQFVVKQNLNFLSKPTMILIPYLIWTRTTEDYNEGHCGKVGYRDYANDQYCTWTSAQAYLFLINVRTKEIIFYKDNYWSKKTIYMPYQARITRSFKRCSQPLFRKLRL